jgi:hypothetical protein
MYEARQSKLINDLKDIYPIEKLNNEYTIRGLELNELSR